MVCDLVPQYVLNKLSNLLNRPAADFDRPPVYADPIRRDKSVVSRARRLRHAVIEAQQMIGRADPCGAHRGRVGPVFNDHGHVLQLFNEYPRQAFKRLSNQILEQGWVHGDGIIPRAVAGGKGGAIATCEKNHTRRFDFRPKVM